jgi:hypothetical protein
MGPFANISSRRHAPRGGRVRRWRWRLAWPPGVPRSQTSGSYTRLTRTARDCGSSQSHVLLRQRRSRTVARGGGQWRSPVPHLTKQSLGWHQPSSVLVFNGGGKHWPDGSGAPPLLIPAKCKLPVSRQLILLGKVHTPASVPRMLSPCLACGLDW